MKRLLIILLILNFKALGQQTPHLNDGILELTNYIASDSFCELKKNNSDIELIDSLYCKAIKIYNGNISEALLCLTFTTLPYNKVPLTFWGVEINIPLPNAGGKIFYKKNRNLPKNFLPDSPKNNHGDKDKLAHFFGNAFLAYNINFFNISKFMGALVELFENVFYINGRLDRRDIMMNFLGEHFGKTLQNNSKVSPSEIIFIYHLLFNFCKFIY